MKSQDDETMHQRLRIGGIAAILLALSGVAAVAAWTATSSDAAGVVDARGTIGNAPETGDAGASVKCAECGVVESTRAIEQPGAGIDSGAVDAATGSGWSEMPRTSTKNYEVKVRMKDGSSRAFMDANPANWRPGERVILIAGASPSND